MNRIKMAQIGKSSTGFTLIELLVVVMVIGILAAVAVPQYSKVVERARAAEIIHNCATISAAEERFYARNRSFTTDFTQLDVTINNGLNDPFWGGGGVFGNPTQGPHAGANNWGYLEDYQVQLLPGSQSNCNMPSGYQIWYGRIKSVPHYYGPYALAYCCDVGKPCFASGEFDCHKEGVCIDLVR